MNKVEKIVYDILKSNPKLKLLVRNVYQGLFDLIPNREDFFLSEINIKEGYFVGFHDISPFSFDEKRILANKLIIPLRMPSANDGLLIGYWNSDFSDFNILDKSFAWNYHKGCRLQWIGKSNSELIFNTAVDGKLCSELYSINNAERRFLDFPIDTVSHDGKYATSFSYKRLNTLMPGYGYDYEDGSFLDENSSEYTGLYLVNIEDNTRMLLFTLNQLAKIQPNLTMKGARHFVTHTEFSPDDQYVSFLHRWTHNDPNKRYSRLVIVNINSKDYFISPTTGMVSHYVWDEQWGLLAYCQIGHVDGHYLLNTPEMNKYKHVAKELNSDGHQSFIPKTHYFVTDTYPDKRRYAKLYKVDLKSDKVIKLADLKSFKKFQSPNIYRHWACDLHPRVSPLGTFVCFDSVHTGLRSMCIMKLKSE